MPDVLTAAEIGGRPSHNDIRELLGKAVNGGVELYGPGAYYVLEVGDQSFIAQRGQENAVRFPYTVTADGQVTLGNPVLAKLAWVDGAGPSDEGEGDDAIEANDVNRGSMAFVTDLRGGNFSVRGLQFSDGCEDVRIQVCKDGRWSHPKFGEINVDASTRKAFVENFTNNVRKCGDLPLDYDHQPGPAPGWIVGLYNSDDALFADVKMTPSGLEKIRNGEYRFFSPEWHPDWQDPETGKHHGPTLFGGGLTNRPFFRGMAAINCDEFGGTGNPPASVPTSAQEGRQPMSDLTPGAGATGAEPQAITAAEVQRMQERIQAVEVENAALRAAEERRGLTDAVSSLAFSEGRVTLAPAGRAALVDELMKIPAVNREGILTAVKGLQFAELGERGFTPAEQNEVGLTASEEEMLQGMAQRNNLKFEEVKANYLTAKKQRAG